MPKLPRRCLCFFWPLLAVLLAGCVTPGAPPPVLHHYTLDYPPPVKGLTPLPVVMQVAQPFQAAPAYATLHMVVTDGDFGRTHDPYHRWRATPGQLVGYFLARDLQRSGGFQAVCGAGSRLRPTHVLEGIVEEFVRTQAAGRPAAGLTVTLTLLRTGPAHTARPPLFQRRYQRRVEAPAGHAGALAEAMSRAMAELSAEVIRDVHRSLAAGD